jgi:hypothetical protein
MPAGPRRRTDPDAGAAAAARAVEDLRAGVEPARDDLRTGVRFALEELAARAPGRSVEVRVAPYAVVQCIAGPRHTRGTPPNVVETDAATWLLLAAGDMGWADACRRGAVLASGERSDLAGWMPLLAV